MNFKFKLIYLTKDKLQNLSEISWFAWDFGCNQQQLQFTTWEIILTYIVGDNTHITFDL